MFGPASKTLLKDVLGVHAKGFKVCFCLVSAFSKWVLRAPSKNPSQNPFFLKNHCKTPSKNPSEIRNVPVTPTPKYFSKSTAVQMGGVLPYKWEASCSTNGRCTVGFPFLRSLEARKVRRYKWGAYCRTNWRCTAVLFRQVVGVGVSETLPIRTFSTAVLRTLLRTLLRRCVVAWPPWRTPCVCSFLDVLRVVGRRGLTIVKGSIILEPLNGEIVL